MQLVARVVVLLDNLADEVGELGDALLLPLELLLGCLQLQHGGHQALLSATEAAAAGEAREPTAQQRCARDALPPLEVALICSSFLSLFS
jgi:hypothetical protein